jgi:hypothetical protein
MNEDAPVALFDMDNSLADYNGALVRDLELLRSPGEDPITEDNIWTQDKQPHIGARMKLIKSQPGWWFRLRPMQEGLDVLEWAGKFGFDVHILTKGPKKHSLAWDEKVQWCQKYIGEDVDIHVTSDKGLVYGKMLYDDYPEYMMKWLKHRPRGLGIMPVTASNKDFSHPNVVMYRGIEDMGKVMKAMRVALERKPGQDLVL